MQCGCYDVTDLSAPTESRGVQLRLASAECSRLTRMSLVLLIQALLRNREHSEEGYDRGASLFGVGTDAPSVNAIPALSCRLPIPTCAKLKGICERVELPGFSVLKRVTNGARFGGAREPISVSDSRTLSAPPRFG